MTLIEDPISIKILEEIAQKQFGNLVKAVVDIEKKIMVIDSELHSDEESFLLDIGSIQQNLWGINIYPFIKSHDRYEFDSMINLRPSQGNFSRSVENILVQKEIIEIADKLIIDEHAT